MIDIATVVSVASIYMKLNSPLLSPFPGPRSKDRKRKVLVYGGSSPLGAQAVKYIVKYIVGLGHKVVTTPSPSSSDWASRHSAKVIIDHTKLSAEVLGELRANGPFDGREFDAIGTPPVTALLTPLLADLEGRGNYFTVFPLLPNNSPLQPILRGCFRAITSYSPRRKIRTWRAGCMGHISHRA
jgi:NADPH:quinone reductase-like Zn-dependent oxidoreductase